MYLNTLMEKKNISRAELSRRSCVPESTLRDILNGKARLDHCEALTVSCIAGVLGTTVEDLLINYWDEPLDEEENMVWPERHDDSSMLDFYMLVDSTMSKLSACGDMRFVKAICDDYWIERFYTAGFYRSAFFLLGLVDHLCKKHHKKLVSRFDAYRVECLDSSVYSLRTLEEGDCEEEDDEAQAYIETFAVPELARFNIFMTKEDITPET